MAEGRLEEVLTWLRQLEEDAGVAPVWEVLFQAMCCPVPQASVQCPPYMPWWQASRALPVGLVFLLCTLAYAGIQAYAARCHAMPPAAAAAPGMWARQHGSCTVPLHATSATFAASI